MNIIYTIAADFPFGTPYASRTLNFCRLMKELGHKLFVICDYVSEEAKIEENGYAVYEDIGIYYSFEERSIKSKILAPFAAAALLESVLKKEKIDLIISSQTSNRFSMILKSARKNKIPIILEICEKFHPSNWKYGRINPYYMQFLHCWERKYQQADGFITISTYLYRHFEKYNKPVVRIPTIIDTKEFDELYEMRKRASDDIDVVFSGSLGGGKDHIAEWIKAIDVSGKAKSKITTNIYGINENMVMSQYKEFFGECDIDFGKINVFGRIPQKNVPKEISKNDFGLILRPNRESSNAGFPTKIAEYLSVGTAVISNRTSDIPNYIVDGYNGFVVEDLSTDSILQVIDKINMMSIDELNSMSHNARTTAEEYFDYTNYKVLMERFITEVKSLRI